jgi:hypothetical protein
MKAAIRFRDAAGESSVAVATGEAAAGAMAGALLSAGGCDEAVARRRTPAKPRAELSRKAVA